MSKLTIFFFRNACTKSEPLQFSQFSVPSDFVCLLTDELCLSLLEDCSVIGSFVITLIYQRGKQNPYIEEEQTTQWRKEKSAKGQTTIYKTYT